MSTVFAPEPVSDPIAEPVPLPEVPAPVAVPVEQQPVDSPQPEASPSVEAPVSSTPAIESAPEPEVYCEWVEGFGCLGTVQGAVGDTYLNTRVTFEMCLSDTNGDETGCQTQDLLSWCENHTFLDLREKAMCLPKGATYDNAVEFGQAASAYRGCLAQATAPCDTIRRFLFGGLPCDAGCIQAALDSAPSERVCRAQATKDTCLAASAPRFTDSTGAPAPAPEVVRPTDNVATCAWVTGMGCMATINNGAEGIRLLENRVKLEACMAYNSEGTESSPTGCPGHAANFCVTKTFTDISLDVCVPVISTYDVTSGRDFIQHYITYKECRGLTGDDCSDARKYLFSGMNCTECGAWADASAINEANCTTKQTQPDCVGEDESGHVFEETLGATPPGAAPVDNTAAAPEDAVEDDEADDEADDGVEDGGGDGEGDDGDGDGVSGAVTGDATCMWIEECCCYPTITGRLGTDYVGARVLLEFCLSDTNFELTGCSSLQYANICNEKTFPDVAGGVTLCLPDLARYSSGADLIDALSLYYTCQGLEDLDCNLARGYLFEGIQCSSCGEVARIAAPLEGTCKSAQTFTQCVDAGTVQGETDVQVIDEIQDGVALGKLAPIASKTKDGIPPASIERLLKPREEIHAPSLQVATPPPVATPVIPASGAQGAGWGGPVAALSAAVAAGALVAAGV